MVVSADIVRVEVPVPPEVRVTLGALKEVPSPVGVEAAERLTEPVKPRLVRVMVEVAEVPTGTFRVVGLAAMEKSEVTVRVTFAEWDSVPSLALLLVPVTVMM